MTWEQRTKFGRSRLTHVPPFAEPLGSTRGIVPYFSVGSSYRRLWVSDAILIGSSPADKGCQHSNFCRAQLTTDPYHANCNSIFAPANIRRIGYVAPFNTNFKQTCEFSL